MARLPRSIGDAVDHVGRLRDLARSDETARRGNDESHRIDGDLPLSPNEPVTQSPVKDSFGSSNVVENSLERTQRRMRWVAQVSEYWPLESLANLKDSDILDGSITSMLPRAMMGGDAIASAPTLHTMSPLPSIPPRGRILLLGSGPGHPSLLTSGTAAALRVADLVLSDKLVPEAVLNMIPKREKFNYHMATCINADVDVEVCIARKFPGNADRAQEELSLAAVEAAKQGKVVVRVRRYPFA